jgi:hypothetical protein
MRGDEQLFKYVWAIYIPRVCVELVVKTGENLPMRKTPLGKLFPMNHHSASDKVKILHVVIAYYALHHSSDTRSSFGAFLKIVRYNQSHKHK